MTLKKRERKMYKKGFLSFLRKEARLAGCLFLTGLGEEGDLGLESFVVGRRRKLGQAHARRGGGERRFLQILRDF